MTNSHSNELVDDAAVLMSMVQNNSLMNMLGNLFNETISKSADPEALVAEMLETCEESVIGELIKLESVTDSIASASLKAKA